MTKRREFFLLAMIGLEVLVFSISGRNFFSIGNFFEIVRLGVEIGLLSLALTPVIVTGGIDLSVGSMMGLCAVSLGLLWRDFGLPIWLAVFLSLLIGLAGGALNGFLVSILRVPPLIVTLGSYSLFRGIAEGLTGGYLNYSGFPPRFLFLAQGYLWGFLPSQMPVIVAAALILWLLLERSVIGRALYAIGYSWDGARYAALPVKRNIFFIYTLSGLLSAAAGVIYVGHLGQAKADAGTGYELIAITAVVLGGASIFGGSGTIAGTLLGLAAIVVLQNGLRLSALPAELAGILIGLLLIAAIASARAARPRTLDVVPNRNYVKLAAVSAAILIGLGIVVLIRRPVLTVSLRPVSIGMLPKAKGDPYFISCRQGAEEAASELRDELIWDGPTNLDPARQSEIVEGWITRGVNAIAVSVENRAGISTVLRKARTRGIKVVTWDADAEPDARDAFINQATPQAIGAVLIDETARIIGNRGDLAIITGALTAANQNEWIRFMRERLVRYPALHLVSVRPSDDDRDKAFAEVQTLLKVHPGLRMIVAISAPAVPGAGEAVKQAGRRDVKVIGLSLPSLCKSYIHDGWIQEIVLWKTRDLGYLAVRVAGALARGARLEGQTSLDAGRLGHVEVKGSDVILGAPFIFNNGNVDQYQF